MAWLKFAVETTALVAPAGNAVRYPLDEGSIAVRFTTTADTPLVGTLPRPVTVMFSVMLPPNVVTVEFAVGRDAQ